MRVRGSGLGRPLSRTPAGKLERLRRCAYTGPSVVVTIFTLPMLLTIVTVGCLAAWALSIILDYAGGLSPWWNIVIAASLAPVAAALFLALVLFG